jgi:hypothetical protein
MDINEMKLKAERLKEQIKFWDEQVLKLIEKADVSEGKIKKQRDKRIDELQSKIVEAKKELNRLKENI